MSARSCSSILDGSRGRRGLLTLEAMKMETPVDGEVVEVLVDVGDQVVSGSGMVVVAAREGR